VDWICKYCPTMGMHLGLQVGIAMNCPKCRLFPRPDELGTLGRHCYLQTTSESLQIVSKAFPRGLFCLMFLTRRRPRTELQT
jgi:hypothetical protein